MPGAALSQLRICRHSPPPLLSFDPTVIKDAQCAEMNEKSIFIFRVVGKIYRKLGIFQYKNDHSSKNKNLIYDFSFDSADSASFMYI